MQRETLLDYFADRIRSSSDFLVYDDGYRTYTYTYDDVRHAAFALSQRLSASGVAPGRAVVMWGENRSEWIVALWGCLLARAVAVPVDYRASPTLLARVSRIVDAPVLLIGNDVSAPPIAEGVRIWKLADLLSVGPRPEGNRTRFPEETGAALAEIIFTSGATAEPKGVQLTHHNILANIVPVERRGAEVPVVRVAVLPTALPEPPPAQPYVRAGDGDVHPADAVGCHRVYAWLQPGRHRPADSQPEDLRSRLRAENLEVLRDHVLRVAPEVADGRSAHPNVAVRWWRYRRVHSLFGFKFWAFVVGAAPLSPDLEAFWARLGFLVVQGYGLTETAPIVTLNHPFRARRGTVGTPIGGVDIQIAPDGEILVRGANVTTGYYNAPTETKAAFKNGWFHTGDIGSLDASGRLIVRGRKKEVIVTPEGLNVFPEDVERVLRTARGVKDAAVVGLVTAGREQVHAVMILEPHVTAAVVLHTVNAQLEEHQKIRGYSVWTDGDLPRTEGTQKLKRAALKRWVETGRGPQPHVAPAGSSAAAVVQRFAPDRQITNATTLGELGLSSLERIELMMALEQAFDLTVDESAFAAASTVGDLQDGVVTPAPGGDSATIGHPPSEAFEFPRWNRTTIVRTGRRVALATFLLPLARAFAWITVEGLEHLESITGPVVYAANHQSHMDTPVILAALPSRRRYQVATAAAKEFFAGYFHPRAAFALGGCHEQRQLLPRQLAVQHLSDPPAGSRRATGHPPSRRPSRRRFVRPHLP